MSDLRPRPIVYAAWCFAVSLVIGAAILGFGWGFPLQAWLSLLIIGFLIFHAARRRNWARWILTIVALTFLVITWDLVLFQLTYSALMGTATVTQLTLELLGCCLLFLPQSGRWYGRRNGVAS